MTVPEMEYSRTPFLVIWETTQACDLQCRHCRASARPERDARELSTTEAEDLLSQAADMGVRVFVLSGGDPLKREDLCRLVRFGADRGLRMATIPAATPLLTRDIVKRLKDSGLSQLALSLDFPAAGLHDAFRGVPGAFDRTLRAIGWAHEEKLALQINTAVCAESAPYLEAMAVLVATLGIVFWEVFFLVPMGRGAVLGGLTASQCEDLFGILHRTQREAEFLVKVTEAPHYRRYAVQQAAGEGGRMEHAGPRLPRLLTRTEGPGHSIGLAPRAVNSGNGILFVSHTGEVFPSGFLPIPCGNVRRSPLSSIYRDSEMFRQLRQPGQFKGACGGCEYHSICGGSRSRAFALTGDPLAADPWCAYIPMAGPA